MASTRVVRGVVLATLLVVTACGADSTDDSSDLLDSVALESVSDPAEADPVEPSPRDVFAELGPGRTTVTIGLADGSPLDVTIITPPDWQAGTTAPALLALPPGDQSAAMVAAVTGRYFDESTAEAGWVIVSPAAPGRVQSTDGGRLYYQDAEPLVELLDLLDGVVVPEAGRWHVAGPSNGGLSAFRFAAEHNERVASVIGLPGYPGSLVSDIAVRALEAIPVALFVGEDDTPWREPMEAFATSFRDAGGEVSLSVRPGQGHVIGDLSADELLEVLERQRL